MFNIAAIIFYPFNKMCLTSFQILLFSIYLFSFVFRILILSSRLIYLQNYINVT